MTHLSDQARSSSKLRNKGAEQSDATPTTKQSSFALNEAQPSGLARWKRDLGRSSRDFVEHVWPTVKAKGWFESDTILPVESITSGGNEEAEYIAEKLDQLGGIDVWHLIGGESMRGIGSRVQYGRSWNTFTVRKSRESGAKTEYEKRKSAIDDNDLYPKFTIHAYISDDSEDRSLRSVACTYTKDLIDFIDPGETPTKRAKDEHGWADFYVVGWWDLADDGGRVCWHVNGDVESTKGEYLHSPDFNYVDAWSDDTG